jgi:DNA-binding beta-propeller fold protein YncE
MTRRRAVVGPLVLVATVGLVVLVVAGVGDPWPARAGIRTIAVSRGPGPLGLVVDSANGRAFLNGTDSLQVLDIATGTLLHRTTVGLAPNGEWPTTIIPDERSGRVFAIMHPLFGPGTDQVAVLNAASGHQVRMLRLPVGSHADQVVVDERLGRAYVLLAPSTGRTLTVLVLDATSGRIVRAITLLTAGPTASLSAPLGRYALDVDTGVAAPLAAASARRASDPDGRQQRYRDRHLAAVERETSEMTHGHLMVGTDGACGLGTRRLRQC